ncbi:MAG: DNA primase [Eubacteriales bacterium]
MIPANIIEDIRYRCDIEGVISSYVTLKRAGSNLKGLCPFHSEKTPSFTVYPSTQSFYCFGCGAAGDVISFVMRAENLDYVSAVEALAKRAGIDLPDFDDANVYGKPSGPSRTRVLAMNLEAAKFYRSMLFDDTIGAPGRQYLIDRKLSAATIKRFGLGYSPERGNTLMRHLIDLGFGEEEIKTAYLGGKGEYGYYDYFRGRVMFPIIDVSGNVIAFGGRIIDSAKSDRKYLNTSDTPAFKKTRNLYALNYAKNSKEGYFILCEGYMDVIALHAAGFNMAVASLGTAFTAEQARIIKKYVDRVILSYDSDEAGQKASNRAIGILEAVGIEAKVLKMTGAKDPDEYIKNYGADAFRRLIEESRGKFDFKLDEIKAKYSLDNAEEKIKALGELSSYIAEIYSSVEREIYISKAANEFSVSPVSIKNDVEAKRRRNSRENDKKRRGELIRVTMGTDVRVNPDYAKNPKAARLEEDILGMIFIKNEYINRPVDAKPLCEEDFLTSLGKRLFSFISSHSMDVGFNPGILNEEFTQDEVSRVFGMIAQRNELSISDEVSFDTYVRALRNEISKNSRELSLEELLAKKRSSSAGK